MSFCHLHVHNEYSVLDGVGTSKQYAAMAKELGQEWCALTNHSNVDGAIEHQKQCLAAGIKPIIGAEMYLVADLTKKEKGETRYHITLLVENQTGWRNLLKLLTIANIDGFYYRPRIDYPTLMKHIDGLVILSACSMSFINIPYVYRMLDGMIAAIGKDRIFLEVMPHNFPEQIKVNKLALAIAEKLRIQVVATNDVHYPTEESAKHQEVLLAIQTKKKWTDKDRWKFNCTGLFFRSEKQMFDAFRDQDCLTNQQIKRAIRRTVTVAKLCENFRIEKQEVYLPSIKNFPTEEDEITFLENRIYRGLRLRLKDKTFGELIPYRERIDMELKMIIAKKFTSYFLIVWDLIKWCEKENILTGPGRGSAGGSLVAYLLFITDLDPLVYGTEFFRFVDESRPDLPDIDCDFEDARISEVRKYLSDKYGEFNVSGLSNFLTMKGKGVLRDVGRVFDVPLVEVNTAAKSMLDDKEDEQISRALVYSPELKRFNNRYPEVIEISKSIEGQIRGCLSGDCRLVLPNRNGIRVKKIKKLYEENYRGKARAYDLKKDVLFFDDIVDIWQSGIKKVYDLTTNNGNRVIRLTTDHKLLTKNGWKEAGKIKIGEFIATNGAPWNKGLKGRQVAWNKGLTKDDHPGVAIHSERMKKNNPSKLPHVKKQVSERSFKHGRWSLPQKYKKSHPICEICGNAETKEIHHIDLDIHNNDESNLLATCIKCHHEIHWSMSDQEIHKINPLRTIGWSKVISFEYAGKEMTYDIQMKSSNQNFVCNKIIAHNCGQHAAGVCISKNDLREGFNCNLVSRSGTIVANWDMRNAEYCGLMKLDVLSLSALTILSETKRLIKQNHNVDIDYKKLTFDDPKVFAEITAGHTTGAFQISTHGMTNYCMELGVENFAMIYAVTALWRPGPMQSGMTESYSKRKRKKEKVEKIHPIFDKITAETFGVIIYQEQVMKVVNQLAGIPMATCNKIRKVMGKSMGHAAFDKYKEEFLQGCKNKGLVKDDKAIQIWNMMSESGSYSFNLSHSVAYSMITYHDMWSKTFYPTEFITACLTLGNKDKNVEYIREARRLGLKINLPKIGISHPLKWNCDNKKNLFAPFISIKGVGDVTAEKIAKFKEKKKKVKSFFTLPDESKKINGIDEKTMNILNCVKAFDPDYVTTDEDLRKFKKFFIF